MGELEQNIKQIAVEAAEQVVRTEMEKPDAVRFEPLIDAKKLAEILGYTGKRPEKGVYELVRNGHLPKDCIVWVTPNRMKFHPDRIRLWMGIG